MFNINNGHLAVPGGDETGPTPRTPEILNSLMAMTDPFKVRAGSEGSRRANSPPYNKSCTAIYCSPPSVQHTRTQLIKEGLKLTLQSKLKAHSEPPPILEVIERPRTRTISDDVSQDSMDLSGDGLTPEDEERRRRRRERNKIAATKCRLKKRERTVNLVQESEVLESQNIGLKSQIQALEEQKRNLVDLLNVHNCVKVSFESRSASSPSPYQDQFARVSVEASSTYAHPSTSTIASSSSYHRKMYCESYSTSTSSVGSAYHRQQEARYCRTGGASTSSSSFMYNGNVVGDANVMLPYCSKSADQADSYIRSEPIYANLNVDSPHTFVGSQDSPTSSVYTRPSSISVTTSSSDYESNTELLDSPSVPPSNYHHYDKDNSIVVYPSSFPTGSCIT